MKTILLNFVAFSFLLFTAVGLANSKAESYKKLAVDQQGCEIGYHDANATRDLVKKCKSKAEPFFKLEDTSAPLAEGKVYGSPKAQYLVTRWATGQSEEVVVFDLKSSANKPAFRIISDGPSKIAFDKTTNRVKIDTLTRTGETGATAEAKSQTYYWPK